ncbi:MAG: sorbosone dehydrogenase family protein [Candidatus Eisenbacteria bacterium]|nr:sorbosone dehydrogenase family protein [Candidatus Eisenbacteria bacterium]
MGTGERAGRRVLTLVALVLTAACAGTGCAQVAGYVSGVAGKAPFTGLDEIRLPEGFRIETYAADVPGARSLCLGDEGTVFVGTRERGNVYALRDDDGVPGADTVYTIASGLRAPNGVAFRGGSLYVAEVSRVLRFDDIESLLDDPPEAVVVSEAFPDEAHHGWKFIAFGPDGRLYVPVGAPCNVCERDDERFASIMRMQPDGTGLEVYAGGVRNTVGFDWHPETGVLWFTDNGRDWMGNDEPPDELNRAPRKGLHFGFPYFHGRGTPDPEYGVDRDPEDYLGPEIELEPHVAALGMRFYTGEMFPDRYRGQVFIAEHGSWNRDRPIGYRVTLVRIEESKAMAYEVFAEGWLSDGDAFGRPVDVLVMPDGALLVSDDRAGRVYRISYEADEIR